LKKKNVFLNLFLLNIFFKKKITPKNHKTEAPINSPEEQK